MKRIVMLVGALALCPPAAGVAQEVLAVGSSISGALDSTDALDEYDSVHDLVSLDPGARGRVLVTLTSADFDVYLEWGSVADGVFESLGAVDDSPGLPADTDALLYLDVPDGSPVVLRVTSLSGGADGAYRIEASEAAAVGSTGPPRPLTYDTAVLGALDPTDPMSGGRFVDTYLFDGAVGERVLLGLEADFDALLRMRGPSGGVYEDDDGFGGTDAFLEVDVPEDGRYEVEVTSYEQAVGDYRLTLLDAPPLAPGPGGAVSLAGDPAGGGAAALFTSEEKEALRIEDGWVRNDAVGFRFPSPGGDFYLVPDLSAITGGAMDAENLWGWGVQDPSERNIVLVMAIRIPSAVTENTFNFLPASLFETFFTEAMDSRVEGAGFRNVMWEERRFEEAATGVAAGAEISVELVCGSSQSDVVPGLFVCLYGVSEDRRTFLSEFRRLEIDPR